MKRLILIIAIAIFIAGCSKRTRVLDSKKISKTEKSNIDSVVKHQTNTIDKSLITIEKQLDTSVTVTGKTVTGEVDINTAGDNGVINQHFSNDDVDLFMSYNKSTGKVSAKATPKPKNIPLKFQEKTTIQNDITRHDDINTKIKKSTFTKADSVVKLKTDHKDPSPFTDSIKSIINRLILILIIVAAIYFAIKKYFKF